MKLHTSSSHPALHIGLVALACAAAGCVATPRVEPAPRMFGAVVRVQERWLELRVSQPQTRRDVEPLVVFVTGDGGWRGKDLDAFEHLTRWGYPVAGFSAPAYLDHLAGDAVHLPPRTLARDFASVIAAARVQLALPATTPVVLFGISRGADLAVVAAAERTLRRSIGGVLAVGLTTEEEFVRRTRRSAPHTLDEAEPVKPYEMLRRVDTAVCVIQSTNDQYVRAADARVLFGPNSARRQFHAIESRDHSFSDSRETLYATMRASLQWVAAQATPASPAAAP